MCWLLNNRRERPRGPPSRGFQTLTGSQLWVLSRPLASAFAIALPRTPFLLPVASKTQASLNIVWI